MKERLILLSYTSSLFLSAFLVFSLQPLFTKLLLPALGGGPSVWNVAMVFFQGLLFCAYAYAHFLTVLFRPIIQVSIHLFLLFVFTIFLPFGFGLQEQVLFSNPILWQVTLMFSVVGGPFFIISASAPLLQKWFVLSSHQRGQQPYFLYAISNVGSLGALLLYPFLIEPLTNSFLQIKLWTFGYLLLIILMIVVASFIWDRKVILPKIRDIYNFPKLSDRLAWIYFSLIPASLLLGFTSLITSEVASIPLFWVIPLVIYLITFILAFSNKDWIRYSELVKLVIYSLCFISVLFVSSIEWPKLFLIFAYLWIFLVIALYCHTRLVASKPSQEFLTSYYLYISLGGVLGSIFIALTAPKIFIIPLEISITLIIAACTLIDTSAYREFQKLPLGKKLILVAFAPLVCSIVLFVGGIDSQKLLLLALVTFLVFWGRNLVVFVWTLSVALLFFPPVGWKFDQDVLFRDRNYFGILTVKENNTANLFSHGVTLHGAQLKNPKLRLKPITYYHPAGPVGDIFRSLSPQKTAQNIAVLGLGVGSVACYQETNRNFDFYEIDPAVVKVAEDPNFFSFLKDCGSPYQVIIGDARIKMKEAKKNYYDLIFIDVFSSDNIPVHIMTKEAMILYLEKIKEDGIISMHISNRYLDLRPVLAALAKDLGLTMKVKEDPVREDLVDQYYYKSVYAVFAKQESALKSLTPYLGWFPEDQLSKKVWTDGYANVLEAF